MVTKQGVSKGVNMFVRWHYHHFHLPPSARHPFDALVAAKKSGTCYRYYVYEVTSMLLSDRSQEREAEEESKGARQNKLQASTNNLKTKGTFFYQTRKESKQQA